MAVTPALNGRTCIVLSQCSEGGASITSKPTSAILNLRFYNAQVGKALTNVKAINKVLRLGMVIRNLLISSVG